MTMVGRQLGGYVERNDGTRVRAVSFVAMFVWFISHKPAVLFY
jgi:hypothetical protein